MLCSGLGDNNASSHPLISFLYGLVFIQENEIPSLKYVLENMEMNPFFTMANFTVVNYSIYIGAYLIFVIIYEIVVKN